MGNQHAILIGLNAPEVFGGLALLVVGAVLFVMLLIPVFKGIGWVMRHIFAFIKGEIGDFFRLIGAFLLGFVYLLLILGSVLIARWSAASHFGRALQSEIGTGGACIYRLIIGNPVKLFGLSGLTEGIERRLPEVVRGVPSGEATGSRTGQFEGYRIVGTLPGGGSGAKLYIAVPDSVKAASFARSRMGEAPQVVIKCFTLGEGSSLNQIVRESRSLEAAKRLGLILDDDLSPQRFYYVTRYVPGESLSMVTRRLHGISGPAGLGDAQLRACIGYAGDLLQTLSQYHRGGLWHKDVKPDNIIVDGGPGAAAHLVDFGLVSSLRSAMTLTTHGTEYFRDPELVRQALKGVKVHEVDGTRFDLYAAGAVLFSMMEDSFPAHGVLSQVTKRCPDALKWIIRRAMTDYDKRYMSAEQMLADLRVVAAAADPFGVKPVDLPSMSDGWQAPAPVQDQARVGGFAASPFPRAAAAAGVAGAGAAAAGVAGVGGAAAGAVGGVGRSIPRMRVVNWWTGRMESDSAQASGVGNGAADIGSRASEIAEKSVRTAREVFEGAWAGVRAGMGRGAETVPPGAPWSPPSGPRKSASDQLASARARVHSARERARQRVHARMGNTGTFKPRGTVGIAVAVGVFLLVMIAVFGSNFRTQVVTPPLESRSPEVYVNGARAPETPAGVEGASGAVRPQSMRIVVVNNLRQLRSPETNRWLRAIDASLAHCEVIASVLSDEAHTGDVEGVQHADASLVAQASFVLNGAQIPADSSAAAERFDSWFANTAEPIDAVLWIEPPLDPQNDQPRLYLFTPGSASGSERTKVIVEALRQAMSA